LPRGIKQAQQAGGCSGQDLLQGRAALPDRLQDVAERGADRILGMNFADGLTWRDELLFLPAPGRLTVEANPVLMPAGIRIGRVAMPHAGEQEKRAAGFNGH